MNVLVGVSEVVVLGDMEIVEVVRLENRCSLAVVILLRAAVVLSKGLQDSRVPLVLAKQH